MKARISLRKRGLRVTPNAVRVAVNSEHGGKAKDRFTNVSEKDVIGAFGRGEEVRVSLSPRVVVF